MFENLPERQKGILLIVAGAILLLHSVGILTSLFKWLILGFALYLIFMGVIKLEAHRKIMDFINKKQK